MNTLFVSALLPPSPEKDVFGYALRANVVLEAAASLGDLDLLYYVYPNVDLTPEGIKVWEEHFSSRYKVNVRVTLCPLETPWQFVSAQGIAGLLWQCLRSISFTPLFELISMRSGGDRQIDTLSQRLADNPDLLVVQNIPAAVPLLHQAGKLPPVVFDLDGIEHLKYEQQNDYEANWKKRFFNRLIIPSVKRCERETARLAMRTLLCSVDERDSLRDLWGLPGIVCVPNALEKRRALEVYDAPSLLFIGIYEYWPNRDAVNYLLREIWPQVRAAVPDARVVIAGPFSEHIESYREAIDGVEFTGFVDDLEALYVRSRVVTCPLRAGSGTRLKILEAASYAKPLVSTSLGAFGIDLRDQKEILIRDTPDAFAQACIELLRDDERCKLLGGAAKRRVDEYYDRGVIVEQMKGHLVSAIEESAGQTD